MFNNIEKRLRRFWEDELHFISLKKGLVYSNEDMEDYMKKDGRIMLSYNQFQKEIRKRIKGYLPSEYGEAEMIIEKAAKNNNQDSDILIICRAEGEPYPSFDLKLLHENYISGSA